MIHRLTIERFRGIRELTLRDLGRVNLIVGENNSGKSTVLEAVDLGLSGDPRILRRRGPRIHGQTPQDSESRGIQDAFHFLGEDPIEVGFELDSEGRGRGRFATHVSIQDRSEPDAEMPLDDESSFFEPKHEVTLKITSTFDGESQDVLKIVYSPDVYGPGPSGFRVTRFLGAAKPPSLNRLDTDRYAAPRLASLYSEAYREGMAPLLRSVLARIEPRFEEVALLAGTASLREGSALEVKLKDIPRPIPLSSMGEGFASIIAVVGSLASVPNGVCTVDEIENGIHYSAQKDLWRAVRSVIEKTDAQLWATTHSYECVRAAWEAFKDAPGGSLRVHRLERRPDGSHRTRTMDDETLPIIFRDEAEIR